MSSLIPQNPNVYTDVAGLQSLKGQVKSGDQGAIKDAAKQFEAVFIQMMIAGMRKTIQMDEESSNAKEMYYDLFDKQVALNLADKGGIGLAQMLMQTPGFTIDKAAKDTSVSLSPIPASISPAQARDKPIQNVVRPEPATGNETDYDTDKAATPMSPAEQIKDAVINFNSPSEFINTLWNTAKDVIRDSGIDPRAVIAQAALETGWGKHVIKDKQGESSFNLFGIKSGRQWTGDKVYANTLEFKDGVMFKANEGFRSYSSVLESVQDYIHFLKNNPRYQNVLENAEKPEEYVRELQKAGYATDPNYAKKIIRIMHGQEFNNFFKSNEI